MLSPQNAAGFRLNHMAVIRSCVKGYIEINTEVCKGCGICVSFCPQKSLSLSAEINASGYPVALSDEVVCNGCAICALVCPDVAIEVYRG
ncbi:indolepyruvate ferredoxin oxidoreductase subunit alpha [Chloroflexota bacterium]